MLYNREEGNMTEEAFIDLAALGKRLRDLRKAARITSTDELSRAVEEVTGIRIHPKTIEKIERGAAGFPSIEKVAAIVATIQRARGLATPSGFSSSLGEAVFSSTPQSFRASSEVSALRREVESVTHSIAHLEEAAGRLAAWVEESRAIDRGEIEGLTIDGNTYYRTESVLYDGDLEARDDISLTRARLSGLEAQAGRLIEKYPQKETLGQSVMAAIQTLKERLDEVAASYEVLTSYFE